LRRRVRKAICRVAVGAVDERRPPMAAVCANRWMFRVAVMARGQWRAGKKATPSLRYGRPAQNARPGCRCQLGLV